MAQLSLLAAVEVGSYVSAWKAIPLVIMLLAWARFATWVSKDCKTALLPQLPMNMLMVFGGIPLFAMFFLLPNFWAATAVLVLGVGVLCGVYIGLRAQKKGLGDLTGQFQDWIDSFKSGPKQVKAVNNTIQFLDRGGAIVASPLDDQPEYAGFVAVQEMLLEPMTKGAQMVQIAASSSATKVSYQLDGVTYEGMQTDRAAGDGAVQLLKMLAGLDLNEKRKPQRGMFRVQVNNVKKEITLMTAGSTAGESAQLQVDVKRRHDLRLEQLGMSDLQLATIQQSIATGQGLVLVAGPKGQGLTTAMYAVLKAHDAFLSHILTIERAPEVELEGITQNKLPAGASPQEELKMVSWVCSQEPDVVMVTSIEDAESARELAKHSANEKRVYVGLRAASGFDALSAWRKLVGDDKLALRSLSLVISVRLARRLCPACKTSYEPDPASLAKMGMNPANVQQLFQERTEPLLDQRGNPMTCEVCQDVRFKGRIGIYEVLPVDDEIKDLLLAGASSTQLRSSWKKSKIRFLQDAAFDAVASGETSVREAMRVFGSDQASAKAPSAKS